MENGFRTGALLGDLFLGKSDGSAYTDQLGKNYQAQKYQYQRDEAMENAARERAKNLSRSTVTAEVLQRAAAGDMEAQAIVGAGVLGSSETMNLRNYTGGAEDFQKMRMRQAAVDALGPSLGAGNANLAGLKGEPLKRNTVTANGQQLDPYIPGDPVTLTPLGRANEAGKTLSAAEADAKNNWIIAQANKKIASGDDEDYVEAWVANEMVKAGIEPVAAVDEPIGEATKPGATKPAGKTHPRPTPDAVKMLWSDPSLRSFFAEKYGDAAAKEAMRRMPK